MDTNDDNKAWNALVHRLDVDDKKAVIESLKMLTNREPWTVDDLVERWTKKDDQRDSN